MLTISYHHPPCNVQGRENGWHIDGQVLLLDLHITPCRRTLVSTGAPPIHTAGPRYLKQQADEQGKGDATRGVKETTATGAEHFVQIHSKAERDDRGFQQEFSEFSAVGGVRVRDG